MRRVRPGDALCPRGDHHPPRYHHGPRLPMVRRDLPNHHHDRRRDKSAGGDERHPSPAQPRRTASVRPGCSSVPTRGTTPRPVTSSRRTTPLPPGWARRRERILRRDDRRCQWPTGHTICGATATHVDHRTPAAQGGSDDDSNLWALCAPHHASKTGREAQAARPQRRRRAERHPGWGGTP